MTRVGTSDAVRGSASWAAWGDALGYITELTDVGGLAYRAGVKHIETTVPWKRTIGGRNGVSVALPAGTYSDDTQLRLAIGRTIRSRGEFDVSAFAKVELVSWRAYALGAGRGSLAAASNAAKISAKWTGNFYRSGELNYFSGGGNGAAMRIQPHVWACSDKSDIQKIIVDVVRDAVVTHGHMRAIAGAVFHAILLARAFVRQAVPGPDDWTQAVSDLSFIGQAVDSDDELRTLWLPAWERESGRTMQSEIESTQSELNALVVHARQSELTSRGRPDAAYHDFLGLTGGYDSNSRGSGTITSEAAAALAHWWADSPEQGLVAAANTLGSDTDTIATMAGAILGAVHCKPCPGVLQDRETISREADRLYRISQGEPQTDFRYPDPLNYNAPRTALDLIGLSSGQTALSGLGILSNLSDPVVGDSTKRSSVYQWADSPVGTRILTHRRVVLKELPATALPAGPDTWSTVSKERNVRVHKGAADDTLLSPNQHRLIGPMQQSDDLSRSPDLPAESNGGQNRPLSLNRAVEVAKASEFDALVIGKLFLEQIRGGEFDADRAAGLAGMIAREIALSRLSGRNSLF